MLRYAFLGAAFVLAGCSGYAAQSPQPNAGLDATSSSATRDTAQGPAVKRAPLVYVSDYEGDSVAIFDAKSGTPTGKIGGLSAAAGLFVDKHHRLWVANSGAGDVLVFERGATSPSLTLSDPQERPFDVTVCPNGTAYVSNYYILETGLGSISVYRKNQTTSSLSLADPKEYENFFITCDAHDNVFTTLEVAGLASQVDEYPGG